MTARVSKSDSDVPFDPVEHSVYDGRERLGRYSRTAVDAYAAFDAEDHPLGEFSSRRTAYLAVVANAGASTQ